MFSLPCNIAAAALHISGIGYSTAFINGKQVASHELSPTWTRYEKMVLYVTHDITHLLRANSRELGVGGSNSSLCDHVIEVMLGSGHFASNWYDGALSTMLLSQINAQPYSSPLHSSSLSLPSSVVVAATGDASWSFTSDSPILSSSVYGGEAFNATAAYHEDEWSWQPAVCAPPIPQHLSHPSAASKSSSSPPLPSAPPRSPSVPTLHRSVLAADCALAAQLNGSKLVPQRQASSMLNCATTKLVLFWEIEFMHTLGEFHYCKMPHFNYLIHRMPSKSSPPSCLSLAHQKFPVFPKNWRRIHRW